MKRKTSSLPSLVYKYRLWAPTLGANLVEETFVKGRWYFNQLVTIENRRRQLYRAARARLQPPVAELTKKVDDLMAERRLVGMSIREAKAATRMRSVPEELASKIIAIRAQIRIAMKLLTAEICKGKDDPLLIAAAEPIDAEADAAVKALRNTLYWGTYQLVEDAIVRSKKDTRGDLSYKENPIHQLHGRIGIQIQGGLHSSELADDTRIQLLVPGMENAGRKPLPRSERSPRGKLRLRVGTVPGGREPIWAEFPVLIHRALPDDAVIKWAVVTRRPGHLYCPWIYHLCLTVESAKFERTSGNPMQAGEAAINFGWRLENGVADSASISQRGFASTLGSQKVTDPTPGSQTLRVATINNKVASFQSTIDGRFEAIKKSLGAWVAEHRETLPGEFLELLADLAQWGEPRRLSVIARYWLGHRLRGDESIFPILWAWHTRWLNLYRWVDNNHAYLPKEIYDRFEKCKALQSTIDTHFEVIKKELGAWVAEHRETLPDEVLESLAHLSQWREPRRLSEIARYWSEHRLPADEGIFPVLWAWHGKWIHLYQYSTCNRKRALNARSDFYRNLADEITRSSVKISVEDFNISRVAERAREEEEETGGQAARENRTRAAVSDLRIFINQAAAKNHCETQLVKPTNNTLRCNVCGRVFDWDPARAIVRTCPECSSTWDQDANNTENIHDRVASGEVATLV